MIADLFTQEPDTGPLETCEFDHGTVSLIRKLADGISGGRRELQPSSIGEQEELTPAAEN